MRRQLHIFPSFAMGGAQRRLIQLATALADEWSHTIVTLDGEEGAASAFPQNVRLEVRSLPLKKGLGLSPENIATLKDIIRDVNPSLLCTYNWGSIEAILANRVGPRLPHLHFEDGFGPDEVQRLSKARNLVRRIGLATGAHLVVPSVGLAAIGKRHWGVPPHRLHHIPNGIDTSLFQPSEGESRTQMVIGYVGALRPEKNPMRFLEVVEGVSGLSAIMVGGGPEEEGLRRRARSRGLAIHFAGHIDNLAAEYRRFDALLLTSDTEQMPLAVLEAMASGLPVVSTNVGDVRNMVSAENLPFIAPGCDPADLTKALQTLALDPALRRKVGAANRQKATQQYSQSRMISAYCDLYANVTASAHPSLRQGHQGLADTSDSRLNPAPPQSTEHTPSGPAG